MRNCISCNHPIDDDTAYKKDFCSVLCWQAETDVLEVLEEWD